MSAHKLCVNCVHYRHENTHYDQNRCTHPLHGIDPVTGAAITPTCENQRKSGHARCGQDGHLFEQRALVASQPQQPGADKPVDFTPGSINAVVAAAMIGEAIDFMEGFRDAPDQVGVVDILTNLETLARQLEGGAA